MCKGGSPANSIWWDYSTSATASHLGREIAGGLEVRQAAYLAEKKIASPAFARKAV